MVFTDKRGRKFTTDKDLRVESFGFEPRRDIQNPELAREFQERYGRSFLGADEIVSHMQQLVSTGMDFAKLEDEILKSIREGKDLMQIDFDKTATGIGRGHSLGGLASMSLGLNGTKMIDSGLTGFVASRSLATSSRRRETTAEEIAIPESITRDEQLLAEYLQISEEVFDEAARFKEKFGKRGGVETFNKVIPYNSPADVDMNLPLDTLAALAVEVRHDQQISPGGKFLPREVLALADMLPDLTKKAGMNIMFSQRIQVPRDTYFHYTVFKDPSMNNETLEQAQMRGMPLEPLVIECNKNITPGFLAELEKTKQAFEEAKRTTDPQELAEKARDAMIALRDFVGSYNESVHVKILDSLSWRVWSEQKRHATLRQGVESVYSAADRAYEGIKELWPLIRRVHENGGGELPLDKLEKLMVMDEKLKRQPELVTPYVYHTARQLMFYEKLLDSGIEKRDALYIVPKDIRVRTMENYDLINLIDLEQPLRLCSTCEPERNATSWKKREIIRQAVPELNYFTQPKCNLGFCTEGNFCGNIAKLRDNYTPELHKATKEAMLAPARHAAAGI